MYPTLRRLPQVTNLIRQLSTRSGQCCHVIPRDGYAILEMDHRPANTLTSASMTELADMISYVESDSSQHGLILSSAIDNIFSSGLDLNELIGSGECVQSSRQYYTLFQDLWFRLYKSRLTTVAAITGHCIAGGCALAVACDYRVLADTKLGIGITSVQLGIPTPPFLVESVCNITGWTVGARILQQARLLKPREALRYRLVDEMTEKENVIQSAERQMKVYLSASHKARTEVKFDCRRSLIDKEEELKRVDLEQLVNVLQDTEAMKVIQEQLEKIKSKKKS